MVPHLSVWLGSIAIFLARLADAQSAALGNVQTTVPWRAGHAAAFLSPYVVLYGGTEDTQQGYSTTVQGSSSVWAWDSRNGSWYNVQAQQQSGIVMRTQAYIRAIELPTAGQMVTIASNSTSGQSTIQKLDTTSWSWSFPTSSSTPPSAAGQYAITRANNTIYTYGGSSTDTNGYMQSNAVLNSLYTLDSNSFVWTSGSNGQAITGHTTCYIPACNCLVTFGGTSTGSGTDASQTVVIYDLGTRSWNLQVNVGTTSGGAPGARILHTANCLEDKMIVYGGGTTQPFDSNVWVLDASAYPKFTWQLQNMNNTDQGPGPRMGHSSVLDSSTGKLYIYGGWGVGATGDSNMYVLDTKSWSWSRIATTGIPSSTPSNGSDNGSGDSEGGSSVSAGTIAGAVVGGVAGLALIAAALLLLLWRRKRRKQREKDEQDEKDGSPYDDGHPFYWTETTHGPDYGNGQAYALRDNDHVYSDGDPYGRKRVSKALTSSFSYHDGFSGRRSEIGDTDKVMTGVLTELPSPIDTNSEIHTPQYSNGTRSMRSSIHASNALLLPEANMSKAQVPSELMGQKPNEFSMPASRYAPQRNSSGQLTDVPIDHYHHTGPASINATEGAPLSSSMEVLQSVKSVNGSSMLSGAGNGAFKARDGVRVAHETHGDGDPRQQDEDNTTYNESISYQAQSPGGPIRYIPGASKQFSLATTTTASAATNNQAGGKGAVPLTHHQYPSSNMSSVPVARPVTPEPEESNQRLSMRGFNPILQNQNNIYNSVSPLEMLAALGQRHQAEGSEQSSQNVASTHTDSAAAQDGSDPKPTATSSSSSSCPEAEDRFAAVAPLTDMLPKRYQVDKGIPPIVGPMNSVLFVDKVDRNQKAVIKSFGRREAWERECRILIKLKSPHVVELLEVLTIQDESRTPMPKRLQTGNGESVDNEKMIDILKAQEDEEDEEKVKYATVLERLDETLSTLIRRSRTDKNAWTREDIRSIAKDIVECLAWCHSRHIAFCDLKPSNVMHRKGERWKLIDFEASRTIGEECVGVITPRYCPPEVARATTYGLEGANGVVATPSVDLWALGCVIYELETKHALFASSIKDETILHFVSHPSPSTPILNNGLRWNEQKELYIPNLERKIPDARARQLIKMLLSRDPAKRGSASSLLEHPYFTP